MNLYPHQPEGRDWLASHRRAYLADAMGLGKTVQAALAARKLDLRSALVICPASAVENWRLEWARWGPKGGFTVPSYASQAVREGTLHGDDFDVVILDEAHYAKNPRAKRTLNALNIARQAPRAWMLSGTPMPNHPGELFPVVRMLWPEITRKLGLEKYWPWFDHFTHWRRTQYGPRAYATRNGDELRSILRQIMLRRTLDDVALDLPPLRVDLSLLPQDKTFAKLVASSGLNDSDTPTSSHRRMLGEYKAPRIGEIIAQELEDGAYRKIVVLAYHKAAMVSLRQKLEPFGVVGFDGSTKGLDRQIAIDTFTRDPGTRVFLAQQTAAGVAINLQVASEIALIEPDWSPDGNAQAIKRIHRIGQDNPCRARIFAVAGSLDQGVMGAEAAKLRMQLDLGLAQEK